LEFALLGPVGVTTGSGELPLGPAKRRSVLAMLLLQPNITVSVEQLITCLWEDEPPAHARTVVQGHVSRLRAALRRAEPTRTASSSPRGPARICCGCPKS
jgi:DNA-binding SARP family transcriptional activator